VPPLRERDDDIELLADPMAGIAREYGRRPKRLDSGAATGSAATGGRATCGVRNLIERLMIMVPGTRSP